MNDETKKLIQNLVTEEVTKSKSVENKELVITPDLLDQFEPGQEVYGMPVVMGSELTIRERTIRDVPALKVEIAPKDRLYVFNKRGVPFVLEASAAWEHWTSNGNWKARYPYLGVISKKEFIKAKKQIIKDHPIDDETLELANQEKGQPGKFQAEKKMRKILKKREEAWPIVFDALVKKADPAIKPPNSNVLYGDSLMSPEHQRIARQVMKTQYGQG